MDIAVWQAHSLYHEKKQAGVKTIMFNKQNLERCDILRVWTDEEKDKENDVDINRLILC